MSITDQINRIIVACWNPGDVFDIGTIKRIALQRGITDADSSIQRAMQEVRDLGTIHFFPRTRRGRYRRLPVGGELEGDAHAITKQAAAFIHRESGCDEFVKQATVERIQRLKNSKKDFQLAEDLKDIERSPRHETVRLSLVQARIGQGEFRQKVVDYWKKCAVTGCQMTMVLRASHIKPWRHCTDKERLDPFNGLLLIPNVDALFDIGLITLDEDGHLKLSALLDHSDRASLGIPANAKVAVTPHHQAYLAHHRTAIFVG